MYSDSFYDRVYLVTLESRHLAITTNMRVPTYCTCLPQSHVGFGMLGQPTNQPPIHQPTYVDIKPEPVNSKIFSPSCS